MDPENLFRIMMNGLPIALFTWASIDVHCRFVFFATKSAPARQSNCNYQFRLFLFISDWNINIFYMNSCILAYLLPCGLQIYKKMLAERNCNEKIWLYLACCCFFLGMYDEADAAAQKGPKCTLQNRLLFHLAHKVKNQMWMQQLISESWYAAVIIYIATMLHLWAISSNVYALF